MKFRVDITRQVLDKIEKEYYEFESRTGKTPQKILLSTTLFDALVYRLYGSRTALQPSFRVSELTWMEVPIVRTALLMGDLEGEIE
jgi:hypothetical protein